MKTVTCKTPDGKIRYYLSDGAGNPVPEVMDYLKFLDNQGKARNTLRLSCYQLQNYYQYLEEAGKDYSKVSIDDIAEFMAWLRNPDILKKVVPIRFEPAHSEQTVNENIDKVIDFYEYLVRRGGLENQLPEKLVKFVSHPQKNYKGFLHGIAENRPSRSNILKMPVPQREAKRISKEEAVTLLESVRILGTISFCTCFLKQGCGSVRHFPCGWRTSTLTDLRFPLQTVESSKISQKSRLYTAREG